MSSRDGKVALPMITEMGSLMPDATKGPVGLEELEASKALLDAVPFPVTQIGPNYEALWSNLAAKQAYDGGTTCHALSHGYESPCDHHGEACPKRAAEEAGRAVTVSHVHTTNAGMELFMVMAVPVVGGGVLEFHIPMSEGMARDSLTGLYGRDFFEQLAHRSLALLRRLGEPYTLALMDIDRFKEINDTYGHAAGDDVMRAVGELLREELREVDVCGRWGGDELVLYFPATGCDGGCALAQRLIEGVRGLEVARHPELKVTASIGIACMDSPEMSLEKALVRADKALYRAKDQGRDRYVGVTVSGSE